MPFLGSSPWLQKLVTDHRIGSCDITFGSTRDSYVDECTHVEGFEVSINTRM
jgi:hypothetical protein